MKNRKTFDEEELSSTRSFEKLKKKNAKKQLKRRFFYFGIMLVLLVIFVLVCVAAFFRVNSINVSGNDKYANEDIIKSSGIEKGVNIYLLDYGQITEDIIMNNPYVKTVKISRSLPSAVQLELTLDEPSYYVQIADEYFVVSQGRRVLERSYDKDYLKNSYAGIKKLICPDISSCIVGEKLIFEDESYNAAADSFFTMLAANASYEGMTAVDISDRFDFTLVYDNRLQVMLGNITDMELKLAFMTEILNDQSQSRGTVDITDVEKGFVIINNGLVFD